jgi:predicted amidohydrolase
MWMESINAESASDLIVLPEMFLTGFTDARAELATSDNSEMLGDYRELSKKKGIAITGSTMHQTENGSTVNRLHFWTPDAYFFQDKRHLFTMAGEHLTFQPGRKRETVQFKGWSVFPLVCYDLRFPVWSRNDLNYDVLIYVANWPEKRIAHWNSLLPARAIENQSYVLGVNRVGDDGKGIAYNGCTQVVHPDGRVLAVSTNEEVLKFTLSKDELTEVRKKLPFLPDADSFTLEDL